MKRHLGVVASGLDVGFLARRKRACAAAPASSAARDATRIEFGCFAIRSDTRVAMLDGTELEFTSAEFDLRGHWPLRTWRRTPPRTDTNRDKTHTHCGRLAA